LKAVVFYTLDKIKYQDIPTPEIGEEEVLVKISLAGLCGTDIYKMKQGTAKVGSVLGHEVVGTIEEKGSKVKNLPKGRRVFLSHHCPCYTCQYCQHENYSLCRTFQETNIYPGAFAEFVQVPPLLVEKNIISLPDSLSDEQAVLIEPLACAWRNIKRISPLPEDKVTIIGAGSSGLMHILLLKTQGISQIQIIDMVDWRLDLAKQLGASSTINLKKEVVKNYREADVVIVTVGNQEAIQEGREIVRTGGKLSIFAQVPSGTKIELDPNLIYYETLLMGTYSSTPEEQKEVFGLMAKGQLDKSTLLITHKFHLKDFKKAVQLALKAEKSCKILLYP